MTVTLKLHIDDLMLKYNLTQAEMAEKTGVRQAAISQMSRGFVSRISIEHIEKIANAFNINDISDLMTLEFQDKR